MTAEPSAADTASLNAAPKTLDSVAPPALESVVSAAEPTAADTAAHTAEPTALQPLASTASPTSAENVPAQRRRGLRRGTLTPDMLVTESLRLLDEDGIDGFSLPKLGRALGADQTAVYRHFASKDDLVLAIADRLIEEAMAGFALRDCWIDTLADMARRLRRTYVAHPAAASISAYRTTQRPAELRTVDVLIGALLAAGFEGAQAALMFRVLGDFALAGAGFEASFLALDERVQQTDRSAWTSAYFAVSEAEHPNIAQIRTHLPAVVDDEIFETLLALMLDGLVLRAPRPCPCGRHEQA
jgi:AcrR family transcriptional regulator